MRLCRISYSVAVSLLTRSPSDCPVKAWERLCLCSLLIVLSIALALEAARLGVTVDEPSHLLSSYLYWEGSDTLPPRDMPPLLKISAGWVPHLLGLPVPATLGQPGHRRAEWDAASDMMNRMEWGAIEKVFFLTRLPMLVFPLLATGLLWWWSRQLFGPVCAMLLAVALALEPTARGHSSILKNDIASLFAYLLFWYCAWRYWKTPATGNAVALGGALFLAVISKLSMLFLLGVAPLIVTARCLSRKEGRVRAILTGLSCVLLIPYLGTLAAYQFETRLLHTDELSRLWADPAVPKWFVAPAAIFRVLPVASGMWEGCVALFSSNHEAVPVYLMGQVLPEGSLFYFPAALAVKVPGALQLLIVLGIALALFYLRKGELGQGWAFWLIPGFLYITLASLSRFQLGVRLVLPALPFGLMLCGVALQWLLAHRRGQAFAALLFCWLFYRSVEIYPRGITYFNVWAGGADNGLQYLADSNLDWGQGLPDLADFARERGIRKLHLSYFGFDIPYRYFPESELEVVAPPWDDSTAKGEYLRPEPGYYAVSATLLPGHYFAPKYRNYYQVFRSLTPIAKPGHSIYVYRIDRKFE